MAPKTGRSDFGSYKAPENVESPIFVAYEAPEKLRGHIFGAYEASENCAGPFSWRTGHLTRKKLQKRIGLEGINREIREKITGKTKNEPPFACLAYFAVQKVHLASDPGI